MGEQEPITQYHPDADGQLRNVDELRDLVHELSVNIWPIIRHPVVQMLLGADASLNAEVAVQCAHNMVCPAFAEAVEIAKPQSENGEGSLGPLDIPGLDDLFKNL